jgi:predicted nucleic-acid-binding protein
MIAVDTNVLVRLLTGDDPKQTAAARSLFAAEPVWIAKTVLLEVPKTSRRLQPRWRLPPTELPSRTHCT